MEAAIVNLKAISVYALTLSAEHEVKGSLHDDLLDEVDRVPAHDFRRLLECKTRSRQHNNTIHHEQVCSWLEVC